MFSEDTNQIRNFLYFLCNTIVAPLQIAACLYLIYKQVQVATFVGLGYSLIVIPIAGMAFGYVAKVRKDKMLVTDFRVKLLNEILSGIRIIKYYAWETPFEAKITESREQEISLLRLMGYVFNTVFALVLIAAPQIQAILIFYTYISLNNGLDIATAFTTLTLFGLMTSPFIFIPFGLQQYSQCQVAMQRIIGFLDSPDLEKTIQPLSSDSSIVINFNQASFSWTAEEESTKESKTEEKTQYAAVASEEADPEQATKRKITLTQSGRINRGVHTLEDIDVRILRGQLVGIVGRVGSGKSSFLSAVLGEMHLKEGTLSIDQACSVAYCDQRPFVMNDSVKENVLFFSEFEEKRFQETLSVVCLDADVKVLTDGIETEIGERGITLSGGQKTRVSLARAVYADADVYLLDDPLSAVDAHVGEHIFSKCIVEYLKGKTRLLVTHHVRVLPSCDLVIILSDNGSVEYCGTYSDLMKAGIDLDKIVSVEEKRPEEEEGGEVTEIAPSSPRDRKNSVASTTSGSKRPEPIQAAPAPEAKQLMTVEEKNEGSVHWGTYGTYMKTGGWVAFALVMGGQAAAQSLQVWANFFLINWGKATTMHEIEGDPMSESKSLEYHHRYAIILMASVCAGLISRLSLISHRTKVSQILHSQLLHKVFTLPVSFFDTTPIGRIINRFSQDMAVIDEDLASTVAQMVGMGGAVLGSVGALVASTKGSLLVIVFPLAYLYFRANTYFKSANTAMARLEAVSRSPIYTDFSQTLGGTTTIRSFKMESKFITRLVAYTNSNTVPAIYQQLAMQWLSIRLDLIGAIILVFMGIVAVSFKQYDFIPAGYLALGLSYAIQLTSMLKMMVRGMSTLEAQFNSIERVDFYVNSDFGLDGQNPREKGLSESTALVPQVKDADVEMGLMSSSSPSLPKNWPNRGVIEFRNVVMQYRDLEPTLKNISFTIDSKNKIGIAGRTGWVPAPPLLISLTLP
jgi:ATP-binding cassette, subfamily C (CFTR/MRP), member 1